MKECPFCNPEENRIIWKDENVYVLRDLYPVSPSHTLIIPFRHFASVFEATEEEMRSISMALLFRKQQLERSLAADGYNIGVNEGSAAGQTIHHVHIHLIPRFERDVDDPRGGIRNVIPEKKIYPGL
ncbi:MAG: HIT family protein [Candidatus Fermentibacteraceae bacterium]|nr:HIT family protein [Candidatus Fermentibacteraceae bacterium]MBN2609509.1 HIT family protein [Candidatus Fermentibacteraceae bacterium]